MPSPELVDISAILEGHPDKSKTCKNRWYRSKRAGIVALLLVLGVSGGFIGFKKYRGAKAAREPLTDNAAVSRGDIELHFTDSGELTPKNSIDIASKMSGRVIKMNVDEGSRVKKGDTLAVIQPGRSEAERYVPYTITSPIDGVVMRYQQQGSYQQDSRIAKLGDYVTGLLESNAPTYLLTVADIAKLVVKMKISEMDILKLREGMSVSVTIDALPGESFPAQVLLVSPQAEKDQNNLKNFKVEVLLLKTDPRLKPGMTARVDGLLQTRKGVLKVPLSAVFEETGKEFAYLKVQDGKPNRVEVKLGLRNETEAEVQGGLAEGQQLLTEKPADNSKTWR